MPCPKEESLLAYVERPHSAEASKVDDHLAGCVACRQLVFALTPSSEERPEPEETMLATGSGGQAKVDEREGGSQVGRFVIGRLIGRGAMGAVYEANDPTLDRKLAIKVLETNSPLDEDKRLRLLREAKSLAQLNHPNVVSVYDAGIDDGQVFIAMERLDGVPLDVWIARDNPEWRAILEVFLQASRGLHAAHQAGLVHRDVKPQNIIVTKAGEAIVIDFGLVGEHGSGPADSSEEDPRLTQTGAMMGTPAYSSPEQLAGEKATPRSDVFSLCVSLFESLAGTRPFSGTTPTEIRDSISSQQVGVPERRKGAPASLWRTLRKGLKDAPAERLSSMQRFGTELGSLLRRRRRWRNRGLAATAAAAMASGAFFATTPAKETCTGGHSKISKIWGATTQAAVKSAFTNASSSLADERSQRVSELLSDYGDRWSLTHRESCLATERGEQSSELLDQRMACLERGRTRFGSTIGALAAADRSVTVRSVDMVVDLPDPSLCLDTLEALPAPSQRDAVRAIDELLARAKSSAHGDSEEALALAVRASEDATALGYRPVEARAFLVRGELEGSLSHFEQAKASIKSSAIAAAAAGLPHQQARAYGALAHLVGGVLADFGAAEDPGMLALALLEPGTAPPLIKAEVLLHISDSFYKREDHAAAGKHLQSAEAALSQAGSGHQAQALTARTLSRRGDLAYAEGAWAGGVAYHRQALKAFEDLYGENHDAVAHAAAAIGGGLNRLGKLDESRENFERAARVRSTLAGADNEFTRLYYQGSSTSGPEAIALLREAVAVAEKLYGPVHPDLAIAVIGLASVLEEEGQKPEALELYYRGIQIIESSLGPESPELAGFLAHPLELLIDDGKAEEAVSLARRALSVAGPGKKIEALMARIALSYALIELERFPEAREELVKAREPAEEFVFIVPELVPLVEFFIALCDVEAGNPEALALAKAAREEIASHEDVAEILEGTDEWLAEQGERSAP